MQPEILALSLGLLIASVTDLRSGKIPNLVVVFLLGAGIVTHSLHGDYFLPWLGAGLAFAVHFPLWALGVEKAGDAKLIMGLGAIVGWAEMLEASLWCAVLYLPIGLVVLVVSGRLGNLVKILASLLHDGLSALPEDRRTAWVARLSAWRIPVPEKPEERPEPTMLRTAPIIALAAWAGYATDWFHLVG